MTMDNISIGKYYAAHIEKLRTFFALRIGDWYMAEDMAQDLFVRLLNSDRIITDSTVNSLIYTTARRMVIDYYRHLNAIREYQRTGGNTCTTDNNDPASLYSANEVRERLEQGIAMLSEQCQQVYRLHIYDGMKVSAISKQMNINYKVAEHRLGVARHEIRKWMSKTAS